MRVFVVTTNPKEGIRLKRHSLSICPFASYHIIEPKMLGNIIRHQDNNEPTILVIDLGEERQDDLWHSLDYVRHFTHVNEKIHILVLNKHRAYLPDWPDDGFLICDSTSQFRARLQEIVYIEGQKTKRRKRQWLVTAVSMLLLSEVVLLVIYAIVEFIIRDAVMKELYSYIILGAMLTVLAAWMAAYHTKSQRADEKEDAKTYSDKIQSAIYMDMGYGTNNASSRSTSPKMGVMERMTINLEDIKEYYTWSQKQAKYSFWVAIVLCAVGIALVVIAILLPTSFNQDIAPAIISAVGGAVTELLAGTVLIVYKSSLSQLNHYHRALHEDERFLSSVSLVDKLSSVSKQDEMLEKIIDAELSLNSAEHNDIKENPAISSKS